MNTATLNTAELTALHTETLTEARIARTLANIARRAQTLWADGYSVLTAGKSHYCVFSPEDNLYVVFLSETPDCDVFGSSCSCPAFAAYSTCKHFQAVDLMLRDEAQAAAHDALHTDADDGAYARF